VLISIPAPSLVPETFFEALPSSPMHSAVFWSPAVGPTFAGLGEAFRLEVQGPSRFAQLHRALAPLGKGWEEISLGGLELAKPRVFGGLAFHPGACSEPEWRAFADGCFILPRWTYGQRADQAWLSLALYRPSGEETLEADALMSEAGQLLNWLFHPHSPGQHSPGPPLRSIQQLPLEDWTAQIEAIRQAISLGDYQKIVAARRAEIDLGYPIEMTTMLLRLAKGAGVFRFGFRQGPASFIGATPERLIKKQGRQLQTEALAGSIAVGQEEQLLQSSKDLVEHQFVVQELLQALTPFCSTLFPADRPLIRTLPTVSHLSTPIEGKLARRTHVLHLVEALHPTPAVGGVPTMAAVDWIVKHEANPRGWYAGPIGWLDADGDGEFAVALRSGLFMGTRAYLYAGAGIVRDSDPQKEYAETTLKQLSLLSALGVRE
jgi:menaquinone-specific isochorismate synthase